MTKTYSCYSVNSVNQLRSIAIRFYRRLSSPSLIHWSAKTDSKLIGLPCSRAWVVYLCSIFIGKVKGRLRRRGSFPDSVRTVRSLLTIIEDKRQWPRHDGCSPVTGYVCTTTRQRAKSVSDTALFSEFRLCISAWYSSIGMVCCLQRRKVSRTVLFSPRF